MGVCVLRIRLDHPSKLILCGLEISLLFERNAQINSCTAVFWIQVQCFPQRRSRALYVTSSQISVAQVVMQVGSLRRQRSPGNSDGPEAAQYCAGG